MGKLVFGVLYAIGASGLILTLISQFRGAVGKFEDSAYVGGMLMVSFILVAAGVIGLLIDADVNKAT